MIWNTILFFSHLENNSKATIQEKENFGNEEDSAQPLQIKETKEAEIIETISDFIQYATFADK